MLLFANIVGTLVAPGIVLNNNMFYEMNNGDYIVSEDITGTVGNINTQEGGLSLNDFGIVDALKLLGGFIDLLISIMFASLFIAYALPGVVSLLVGIPLVIVYAFAIVGWIK